MGVVFLPKIKIKESEWEIKTLKIANLGSIEFVTIEKKIVLTCSKKAAYAMLMKQALKKW